MPLFSIIIPTYNRGNRIGFALTSLVKQTFKDFEVIICDDGSTDNTAEVVDSYIKTLNLRYIRIDNSGGPAKPRNIGINAARGEWICFLDSDDWWLPEKLKVCLEYILDFDVIYHDMDIHSNKGKSWSKLRGRTLKGNKFESLFLDRNAICNSSAVIRKAIVDRVGPISESQSLFAVEDYDYWLRVAKITERFKYLNYSLGIYWIGDENISISEKQMERMVSIFEIHVKDLRVELRREAWNRLQYRIGRLWQKFGDKENAKACFKNSLQCQSKLHLFKTIFFELFLIFTPRVVWKRI